jgi:putative membrane protein
MRIAAYLSWIAGLTLAIGLVAYRGVGEVAGDLIGIGWGLCAIALFHLASITIDSAAWRYLLPTGERPGVVSLLWKRWVGESVNNLLPAVQLGGYAARARLLYLTGTPGAIAGASVVADLTIGVVMLVVLAIVGVGLLLGYGGSGNMAAVLLAGIGIFAAFIAGFFFVQRVGMFRFLGGIAARLARGKDLGFVIGGAERLDEATGEVYRRRGDVFRSLALRLLSRLVGVGELWLVLFLLGHPVSFGEALLLESLGQAIRAAAFIVPGALGVQEGGYMLLGAVIGLAPTVALEAALILRLREVALGVPGLFLWQWVESRIFLRRARQSGKS